MRLLRYFVIGVALLVAGGLLCLLVLHKDGSVTTAVWIDGSPEQVWQVLTDTAAYPTWNPMISHLSGDLREGNVIEFRAGTAADGMTFHPRILAVRVARELRWKGSVLVPGLFDGEHRFLLERQGGQTHLVQGEQFTGLLVGRLSRDVLEDTAERMAAMNAALKQRVEHQTVVHP